MHQRFTLEKNVLFIVICLNLRSPKFSIDYNVFRFGKTAEFGRLPNFDRLFFGYFTVFYMISDKSVVIKNTFSLHFILFWPLIFILNIQIGISNCLPRICYQKSLGWLVGEKADFGTFGPVFLPKIIFMNFSFTCHVFLTLRSIRHQVCDKKCVRVESAAKISFESDTGQWKSRFFALGLVFLQRMICMISLLYLISFFTKTE